MSKNPQGNEEWTAIVKQQKSSSPKMALIAEYLHRMALPSMWQRDLTEVDYDTWDQLLGGYSLAAIRFAFDTWIGGGKKFPNISDIQELAASYTEQLSISKAYGEKRAFAVDARVTLAILPQIIDRAKKFHAEGFNEPPPLTEEEIENMLLNRRAEEQEPKIKYFPNGNAVYNKTLVQARALLQAGRHNG